MSASRIARIAIATALIATFVPRVAFAAPLRPLVAAPLAQGTAAAAALPKPPATWHADVAPLLPGVSVRPGIPPLPTVAPPHVPIADGSGFGLRHPVDPTSASGSSLPFKKDRNSNLISFGLFRNGDIVAVFSPSSITGHAGLFDERYYESLSSYAVWSANVSPKNGVQRERCSKYRAYDRAYALWVPSEANHGAAARTFAASQVGKPYNVFARKTDFSSFYCSKLVWAAWYTASGVDLDADGGVWVWPIDLVNSRYATVFGYWT